MLFQKDSQVYASSPAQKHKHLMTERAKDTSLAL
jgi:hypothetical protein